MTSRTNRDPFLMMPHFWRARDLGGAEMLRARYKNHEYPPHSHDTYCLALITGGSLLVNAYKKKVIAKKGDLIIIDPGEIHSGWAHDGEGWKLRSLHLDPRAFKFLLDDELKRPLRNLWFRGPIASDVKLSTWFFRLHWCSETDGPALKREELFRKFLIKLVLNFSEERNSLNTKLSEPLPIKKACRYLEANLSDKVLLTDLSRVVSIPPFRLLRSFKKAKGVTPHQWQTQMRIQIATNLLRAGESPADVAFDCGFADQAHLIRTFKRISGLTPGLFRLG